MAIIQELLTRLGFKVDQSGIKDFNKKTNDMAKRAISTGAKVALGLSVEFIAISAKTLTGFEASLQE